MGVTDGGVYSCSVHNNVGKDQKSYSIVIEKRKPSTENRIPELNPSPEPSSSTQDPSTAYPATTTDTTTTTTTASTTSTLPSNPAADVACPLEGYCLNGGTCSFIPWMGELSCSCAPGFQGARCEQKTTSALYSSLSVVNTLCLFGISNPYHSCR